MTRTILVPKEAGPEIHVNEGTPGAGDIDPLKGEKHEGTVYTVKNGEIVVDDRHVGTILAGVPGTALKPERPAKDVSSGPVT
jgi:hypothetical protein